MQEKRDRRVSVDPLVSVAQTMEGGTATSPPSKKFPWSPSSVLFPLPDASLVPGAKHNGDQRKEKGQKEVSAGHQGRDCDRKEEPPSL